MGVSWKMIEIALPEPSETLLLTQYAKAEELPGFYFLRDGTGHILYIGKSNSIRGRLKEHYVGESGRTKQVRNLLHSVDIHYCESLLEARLYEIIAINRYDPVCNVKDNFNHTETVLKARRNGFYAKKDLSTT